MLKQMSQMGFHGWEIVGLPDTTVKEAKERIKIAIKNCNINLLSKKYVINLSPADIKKEGSILDLPIAIAILSEISNMNSLNFKNTLIVGELSLDGKIKPVKGILAICMEAKENGFEKIILPIDNICEASLVKDIELVGAEHLKEVIKYLNKEENTCAVIKNKDIELKNSPIQYEFDFENIKGQDDAKRGLEIASAGMHNVIMVGVPGSGKTLLAKSMPSILPDLSFNEILEITKIYSIAGILKNNDTLINKRPFRSPHHTITETALVGGGRIPKPGEITLAHNGVLFLDELTEFKTGILEVLREPMEDRKINISRANISLNYPTNFMLVAAMNPCPCGYLGSKDKPCTCSPRQIEKYKEKLSGPFLDRIDIHIEVPMVKYESFNSKKSESSESIRKRINKARRIQEKRYQNESINFNSELSSKQIEKYCKLNEESKKLLSNIVKQYSISARTYFRIIKVARTIADLEVKEEIGLEHIIEAVHFKNLS
jgi:magnesium chelatase family protein